MTTTVHPYIIFNGNCREAMTFYQDCLGGILDLQKVADSPMASQWPGEVQHHILHASLVKGSLIILGSDMTGNSGLVRGNNIILSLGCSSEDEINTVFNKLSAGGQVIHALHTFFNGTIGSLTDKFGISWFLKV